MRFLAWMITLFSVGDPGQLGIGVVAIQNLREPATIIAIYNDKTLTTKLYDFDVRNQVANIEPVGFFPDYGLCYFVCLEKTTTYYRVLINDTEEGYIQTGTDRPFMPWESLVSISAVDRRDAEANPLRAHPWDDATIIPSPKSADFDVKKVEGDWIQVQVRSAITSTYGWIKWREGNKLLINFLMG